MFLLAASCATRLQVLAGLDPEDLSFRIAMRAALRHSAAAAASAPAAAGNGAARAQSAPKRRADQAETPKTGLTAERAVAAGAAAESARRRKRARRRDARQRRGRARVGAAVGGGGGGGGSDDSFIEADDDGGGADASEDEFVAGTESPALSESASASASDSEVGSEDLQVISGRAAGARRPAPGAMPDAATAGGRKRRRARDDDGDGSGDARRKRPARMRRRKALPEGFDAPPSGSDEEKPAAYDAAPGPGRARREDSNPQGPARGAVAPRAAPLRIRLSSTGGPRVVVVPQEVQALTAAVAPANHSSNLIPRSLADSDASEPPLRVPPKLGLKLRLSNRGAPGVSQLPGGNTIPQIDGAADDDERGGGADGGLCTAEPVAQASGAADLQTAASAEAPGAPPAGPPAVTAAQAPANVPAGAPAEAGAMSAAQAAAPATASAALEAELPLLDAAGAPVRVTSAAGNEGASCDAAVLDAGSGPVVSGDTAGPQSTTEPPACNAERCIGTRADEANGAVAEPRAGSTAGAAHIRAAEPRASACAAAELSVVDGNGAVGTAARAAATQLDSACYAGPAALPGPADRAEGHAAGSAERKLTASGLADRAPASNGAPRAPAAAGERAGAGPGSAAAGGLHSGSGLSEAERRMLPALVAALRGWLAEPGAAADAPDCIADPHVRPHPVHAHWRLQSEKGNQG